MRRCGLSGWIVSRQETDELQWLNSQAYAFLHIYNALPGAGSTTPPVMKKLLLLLLSIHLITLAYAHKNLSTKDCETLREEYAVLTIEKLDVEYQFKETSFDLRQTKEEYTEHLIYAITAGAAVSFIFFVISIISVIFWVINREKYKKLLSKQSWFVIPYHFSLFR